MKQRYRVWTTKRTGGVTIRQPASEDVEIIAVETESEFGPRLAAINFFWSHPDADECLVESAEPRKSFSRREVLANDPPVDPGFVDDPTVDATTCATPARHPREGFKPTEGSVPWQTDTAESVQSDATKRKELPHDTDPEYRTPLPPVRSPLAASLREDVTGMCDRCARPLERSCAGKDVGVKSFCVGVDTCLRRVGQCS